jgi:hypothetical protein
LWKIVILKDSILKESAPPQYPPESDP